MMDVKHLARRLAQSGRLVILGVWSFWASFTHPAAPQASGFTPYHPSARVSIRPEASDCTGRGQPHCHTCIESALMISPPSRWPSCSARVDLPVPVAPRITTRGSVRFRSRSPGPTDTARAAATAAILETSALALEQLSPWQPLMRRRGPQVP